MDESKPDLTWTCHVCGRTRPDAMIAVAKHDIGATLGHPEWGTCFRHVRYCVDDPACESAARDPKRWVLPINRGH